MYDSENVMIKELKVHMNPSFFSLDGDNFDAMVEFIARQKQLELLMIHRNEL